MSCLLRLSNQFLFCSNPLLEILEIIYGAIGMFWRCTINSFDKPTFRCQAKFIEALDPKLCKKVSILNAHYVQILSMYNVYVQIKIDFSVRRVTLSYSLYIKYGRRRTNVKASELLSLDVFNEICFVIGIGFMCSTYTTLWWTQKTKECTKKYTFHIQIQWP